MKIRTRVTTWGDPWGVGIYGQNWRTHLQITVAVLWWSLIVEFRRAATAREGLS